MQAVAFANNDIPVVAWTFGGKLPSCVGFAIYRIDVRSTTKPSHGSAKRYQKACMAPSRGGLTVPFHTQATRDRERIGDCPVGKIAGELTKSE